MVIQWSIVPLRSPSSTLLSHCTSHITWRKLRRRGFGKGKMPSTMSSRSNLNFSHCWRLLDRPRAMSQEDRPLGEALVCLRRTLRSGNALVKRRRVTRKPKYPMGLPARGNESELNKILTNRNFTQHFRFHIHHFEIFSTLAQLVQFFRLTEDHIADILDVKISNVKIWHFFNFSDQISD